MVHAPFAKETMTAKKGHIVERVCRDCKCISKQPSSCDGDVRLVLRRTFAYTIVAHRCPKHMRGNDKIVEAPEDLEMWHKRVDKSKNKLCRVYNNRNNMLTAHVIAYAVGEVPVGHDIEGVIERGNGGNGD